MSQDQSRRAFLKAGAAASLGMAFGGRFLASAAESPSPVGGSGSGRLIWANLLHLSTNMWVDWEPPECKGAEDVHKPYMPFLWFDRSLWNDVLARMAKAGMTMVVIDLGDAVKYESHPEIAVKGAWTPDELRRELARIREMGLEPIPKLNFSTAHDAWLGPYARCVSTDRYYGVCRDLIAEVVHLFDKPRFFHLGMDEEDCGTQRSYEYAVVRQHDLWWRDFLFYVEQVQKGGPRPWIWSDYAWHHPDRFYRRMPKSVLQSNWHYETRFEAAGAAVKTFRELDRNGYDQIPTGSNWSSPENFGALIEFCRKNVAPDRLLGFLQTTWKPTIESCRQRHMEAVEQVARAIAAFRSKD